MTLPVSPLTIPSRPFKAYLFDMDGTVADTMTLHYVAWKQAVEEAGGTFPEELFWSWGGIPLERIVTMLNERLGQRLDPVSLIHRKESLYLAMLDRVTPVPSVVAHVRAQHGVLPMAIVSGSPRDSVLRTLTALGLLDLFDTLVAAEDYTHGKPHPEPFLTAAERLRVAPADCLVFEDADAGIQSAEAAGMAWVRVPTGPVARLAAT